MAKNKKEKIASLSVEIETENQQTETAPAAVSFVEQGEETLVISHKEKHKKAKKAKKVFQKATFKHKMKVIGCLAALGMFTGCGLGVWYFNTALRSNVDYTSLNAADFYGNVQSVFDKMSVTGGKGWVEEAKAQGKKPTDFSPVENVLLCEYNAEEHGRKYEIIGEGKVLSLGIAQTIYSEKKFDGNKNTFISISAGMITVSTCDVLQNGSVALYQGEKAEPAGPWKLDKTISASDFAELNGVMPDKSHPYIISDKTVDSATEVVYDAESGNYSFTLTLKPVESVLLYYKQVKRSGGLEANPEFHAIEITFTINENWDFVSTNITESYKAVKFGMPVTCDGTLLTNYKFDCEDVSLPV